jgi:hypothetical protein
MEVSASISTTSIGPIDFFPELELKLVGDVVDYQDHYRLYFLRDLG